ncbi:MAG TPA: FAD-binding oxidoreductase [Actinomycetota bacterium]|nr:FAD-binding oxidoreductase [Actinomycetota bacterium]
MLAPATPGEVAEVLADAAAEGRSVRPVGGGTKLGWGRPFPEPGLVVSTSGLAGVVEYNAADLTVVVQAGVRLDELQAVLAGRGQMLPLDPPSADATVGGIVATADSGPLRHSAGGVRDLVLGITVALSDGTVARAGGKVIKNVAGYDLGKLYAGSFGTLGVIVEVALRLHPVPGERASAVGRSADPAALQSAVSALMAAPLTLRALDVAWGEGAGSVLAEVAGAGAAGRLAAGAAVMESAGLAVEPAQEGGALWEAQRSGQRSGGPRGQGEGAVVRVSGLPAELGRVLAALPAGASLVGRGGLGLSWVRLPAGSDEETARAVSALRAALAPRPCVVLDAPPGVRELVDVWGPVDPVRAALDRRVRERFDPAGIMNPGVL